MICSQSRATRRHGYCAIAHMAIVLILISFVSTTYAMGPDISPRIQQPPAAHFPRIEISNIRTTVAHPYEHAASTTFACSIVTQVWDGVTPLWSSCRGYVVKISLWSLCVALMVSSCVLEHKPSPMRLWLALCLAFSWLVPVSLYLHKIIRRFQIRGRTDSFIVTTAMLSFVFIKAFAILGGYNIVALLRVPPCFTLAAWVASHWCNFDVTPEIRFGA